MGWIVKIALITTGLGNVWRGYERFAFDLFDLLKEEIDITLFKGAGETNSREKVIPHLGRDRFLSRIPWLRNASRGPYYFEVLSFLTFLLPHLISERYDIVHFTDCPLANFFFHLRTKLKLDLHFRTLYTNGNPVIDFSCARVDFLHQLTPGQVEALMAFGIPESKIILLPFGVHSNRFGASGIQDTRNRLCAKYGIQQSKRVILAVSAINRLHKRIDYLIDEVARLGPEYFLLVAGHMEDRSVEALAKRLLYDRFKFIHIPFEELNQIYQLADVFVMCSLVEGFGLAFVEAMCARVPVIAHLSPHYRWMVGDERSLTDLTVENNLSGKIKELLGDPEMAKEIVDRNYASAVERFDWAFLKNRYIEMYRSVAQSSKGSTTFSCHSKAIVQIV